MSLVAYDNSSEESDCEENEIPVQVSVEKGPTKILQKDTVVDGSNGHISDEDDDYMQNPKEVNASTFSLSLPRPKTESTIQEIIGKLSATFSTLPAPKMIVHNQDTIEDDDEFLHKKDNFVCSETKPTLNALITKGPVKISVPSLKEFHDVHVEMMEKAKAVSATDGKSKTKGSGLLSILPQAKSERTFSKVDSNVPDEKLDKPTKTGPSLIPDTVKFRRPAYSTEGINDDNKPVKKTNPKKKANTATITEEDDDDKTPKSGNDFFSLTSDDDYSLPDVSANEINMMVAKKAAKIAEVTTQYLKEAEIKSTRELETSRSNQMELEAARKRYHEGQLDSEATQALVGSSAKRRKGKNESINIVDLNSDQILPNRDEWMRTALASSTTYQPTGVLVDEEPAAGTRRKHQITYLAHKAKANEAELQAMWSANRQNRRATQSKYGF